MRGLGFKVEEEDDAVAPVLLPAAEGDEDAGGLLFALVALEQPVVLEVSERRPSRKIRAAACLEDGSWPIILLTRSLT